MPSGEKGAALRAEPAGIGLYVRLAERAADNHILAPGPAVSVQTGGTCKFGTHCVPEYTLVYQGWEWEDSGWHFGSQDLH